MVHLLYFSSFYLSSCFMVVSTLLKIVYSFLYRQYINHIHLNILLLLSPHPRFLNLTIFARPVHQKVKTLLREIKCQNKKNKERYIMFIG
jgi:hypothetical protein